MQHRLSTVNLLGQLSHSSQSRVWQDQPLEQIIDSVFAAYQPLAHWQWSDDARYLLSQLPMRRYCVQYRETPLAFATRLLAEDGLSWRIDPDVPAAPAGHSVILFADSTSASACPANPDQSSGGLAYTGSSSQQQTDSIIRLASRCRLQANRITLASFGYKSKTIRSASLDSNVRYGGQHYAQLPPIVR